MDKIPYRTIERRRDGYWGYTGNCEKVMDKLIMPGGREFYVVKSANFRWISDIYFIEMYDSNGEARRSFSWEAEDPIANVKIEIQDVTPVESEMGGELFRVKVKMWETRGVGTSTRTIEKFV